VVLVGAHPEPDRVRQLLFNFRCSFSDAVVLFRSQHQSLQHFEHEVAGLFDGQNVGAEGLIQQFYRWRARCWWSDVFTLRPADVILQRLQASLRLPGLVDQIAREAGEYASLAQVESSRQSAAASERLARAATAFTIVAIPATVVFSGVQVMGWKGGAAVAGATGLTVALSVLIWAVTQWLLHRPERAEGASSR